jgi:hypothetical protein
MKKSILFLLVLPFAVLAQTTLPTFWDFANPNIENPPNGWSTQLGTGNLTYSGSQNTVVGGLSARLDQTGEFIMIHVGENPGAVSYYMRGTGITPNPSFTGVFKVQQSINGTTWTDLREFTTTNPIPGPMTRFQDLPSASTRFIRFFFQTKESGSNVALDSVFIRQAPPCTCATIGAAFNNNNIANGTEVVSGNISSFNITVRNLGTVDQLKIDSIRFVGDAAMDFAATSIPSPIEALSNSNVAIGFSPADEGSRKAEVLIYTNDANTNPFRIRIYAIGGTLASEPTSQPVNFNISNVRSSSLNVSWSHPQSRPEQYLILRKTGSTITEVPIDGTTYQRGDYIGQAQVAYIGPDTFTLRPTFIHANTTYAFKAFALNGPAGFENYLADNAITQQATTTGKLIGNYYASLNSSDSTFLNSLSNRIAAHDTVFYSQYISRFVNPFLTRDTTQGRKILNCDYTNLPYLYNEPFLWWTGTNSGLLTREHTYAQSWMPTRQQFASSWPNVSGRELTEYNDLHNLFPTHQTAANAVRSNFPFGEVVSNATPSPSGLGRIGRDASGNTVYEPKDDHKGDIARALFYMCVAYNGIRGNSWALPPQQDQAVLKKWHFQDLPDNKEVARHEFIASMQNNRNPFIDSVNYACRINFSNMTWIANPPANCGISEVNLVITNPTASSVWSTQNIGHQVGWNSNSIDSIDIELLVNDTLNRFIKRVHASTQNYLTENVIDIVTDRAQIKLSATNSNTIAISPYFNINLLGGLSIKQLEHAIKIYPNPSNRIFHIESDGIIIYSIEVKDISGRHISKYSKNVNSIEITTPGVYFIYIQSDMGSIMKKVVRMY